MHINIYVRDGENPPQPMSTVMELVSLDSPLMVNIQLALTPFLKKAQDIVDKEWDRVWQASPTDRHTYRFFPSLPSRTKAKFFRPTLL